MATDRFRIDGLKELAAKFNEIPRNQGGPALKRAVMKGGDVLAAAMSAKAPRRAGPKGGFLKASIGHTARRRKDAAHTDVGPSEAAYYGKFVELGTSKMSAQPFMRPALDEEVRKISHAIRDELAGELRKLRV